MTTTTDLDERVARVEEKLDELLEILTEDGHDRFWQAKLAIQGRMMGLHPEVLEKAEERYREQLGEGKEWLQEK